MRFDKLICRESNRVEQGSVLTVDFGGIGELTVRSGLRGEVNWRRLTRPLLDVLRAKLDACDFESWRDDGPALPEDDFGWGLELFDGGKSVKTLRGGCAAPEHRAAFRSILELCGELAENRRQSLHGLRNDGQAE